MGDSIVEDGVDGLLLRIVVLFVRLIFGAVIESGDGLVIADGLQLFVVAIAVAGQGSKSEGDDENKGVDVSSHDRVQGAEKAGADQSKY